MFVRQLWKMCASATITNPPGRSKRVMHERVFFERRFGEGKSLISVGPLANLYARAPPSGVWTIGGGVQGLRSYSNVVGRDLENHVSVLRSQELLFLMVKSVVICLECSRCKQHLKFEALSRWSYSVPSDKSCKLLFCSSLPSLHFLPIWRRL